VLEHADELATDRLALLFRVDDAGPRGEEPRRSVDDLQPHAGRRDEVTLDLLRLALAQQPVVDEYARESVTDRTLHQRRRNGAVDATRQPADDTLAADLRADSLDLLLDDVDHRPGRRAAGDVVEEAFEHLLPVRRVHDLRMELHARQRPRQVLEPGDARAVGLGGHDESGRRRPHRVAVRHPHRLRRRQAVEQRRPRLDHPQRRCAELRQPGTTDLATERLRHRLKP